MTDIDIQILELWDNGFDTLAITQLLNGNKQTTRYSEAAVHRLLIRAKQKRRALPLRIVESSNEEVRV